MHRIRHSLPYFRALGWEPTVITVDPVFVEAYSTDPLLIKTIPADIEVHYVKALLLEKTRKIGLGSLSIRSFRFFRKKGNELLAARKFDLIYFSTTAFHVMALGAYWKKKFKVPFVLDIQDPWRSDFYLDKPANERPPKFWMAYTIDKKLEAFTLPKVSGIISVSQGYCDTFLQRYPVLKPAQCKVITFGGSTIDFEVMEKNVSSAASVQLKAGKINIVYVGRGGHDMRHAATIFFKAIAKGLQQSPGLFQNIHCWFAGTSYAAKGTGSESFATLAAGMGLASYVTEVTDRLPYFETLFLLKHADMLFMPGSTDVSYTASKLYPYILAKRPLLTIFNKNSSVVKILEATAAGEVIAFTNAAPAEDYESECFEKLQAILKKLPFEPSTNWQAFEPFTAKALTKDQANFFNEITAHHHHV